MKMFKDIPEGSDEEWEFRLWARENYKPFNPILGIWHPIVQAECVRMNETEKLVDLKIDQIRRKREKGGE